MEGTGEGLLCPFGLLTYGEAGKRGGEGFLSYGNRWRRKGTFGVTGIESLGGEGLICFPSKRRMGTKSYRQGHTWASNGFFGGARGGDTVNKGSYVIK